MILGYLLFCLCLLVQLDVSVSFVSHHSTCRQYGGSQTLSLTPRGMNNQQSVFLPSACRRSTVLFDNQQDNESQTTTTEASSSTSPSTDSQQLNAEESKYPIDLPSPLLLATSMILAIASTGVYKMARSFHRILL